MAKKLKIASKKIPFLKSDLDLDAAVVTQLSAAQNKFKTRFKIHIEEAQKEAAIRADQKITALTSAKAEKLKEFNDEIKKYRALATELKAVTKESKSSSTSQSTSKIKKATSKRVSTKKKK